jgi:isopentenyl-diphosphate delta-isomerase
VLRRLRHELGVVPQALELILPAFGYRATAADGTVENELCPVYRAITVPEVQVRMHPTEVYQAWWSPWAEFTAQDDAGDPLSSWCIEQVEQLCALGPDPLAWPAGDLALLPAAARP